jgi:hypothetical protein
MKAKEKRILEITEELSKIMGYEDYEFLLDQLILSHMEAEESLKKQDAYLLVMNLKKLLAVVCVDFFSFENFSKINVSEPKNSFDKKVFDLIQENLDTDKRWEMKKKTHLS